MLGRLLYEIPSRLQPATQENRAAPTGLIISNECAPSVPLRSTLGYPDSAPMALGLRQLACQAGSHKVGWSRAPLCGQGGEIATLYAALPAQSTHKRRRVSDQNRVNVWGRISLIPRKTEPRRAAR